MYFSSSRYLISTSLPGPKESWECYLRVFSSDKLAPCPSHYIPASPGSGRPEKEIISMLTLKKDPLSLRTYSQITGYPQSAVQVCSWL